MSGLSITRISLRDFRSYGGLEENLGKGLTILVGPNAAGKTNLIEAIQLLTTGESFRKPAWSELVRWESDRAHISLRAEGDGRILAIDMVVEDGRRRTTINGKAQRRISGGAKVLSSVVFTPDHLRLVKESAEARRTALDSIGIQLSDSYARMKSEYERVLKHRNRLLKEGEKDDTLSSWTDRLVETGSVFTEARQRLFLRISPALTKTHSEISPASTLAAGYLPFWRRDGVPDSGSTTDSYRRHLLAKEKAERSRGTTLSGPHRDDIEFLIDGRNARAFASQGQQRTVALSWKLAEVSVIEQISGQTPVLLLDDVMSELDEERRRALASRLGVLAQTVVTTTNLDYFEQELIDGAKVIRLG